MNGDAERQAHLRLWLTDGVGPVLFARLMDEFHSAVAIESAGAQRLKAVKGCGAAVADAIARRRSAGRAEEVAERLTRSGASVLIAGTDEYPEPLTDIPGRPAVLTMRGTILPRDQRAVALVGSRRNTAYGRKVTAKLAAGLAAAGVTVVSGLARGIDAVAHKAALDAGGRTLAVLASGIDNLYPPEHGDLADAVVAQGAVLSEAPPDGEPIAGLFPQRNRIISGLSLGVVVVEAALRSGALSTARHALKQNRDVFAVPGPVDSSVSAGCNDLIRQGAILVRDADDVLADLGPIGQSVPSPPLRQPKLFDAADQPSPARTPAPEPVAEVEKPLPHLDGLPRQLFDALAEGPLSMEVLLDRTGLRASQLNAELVLMEMRGIVVRLPGGRYGRAGSS